MIAGFRIRPAREDELRACAEIWRAGIDDYGARLGRPPTVAAAEPLVALLRHLRATDPERFLVAESRATAPSGHGVVWPADGGGPADGGDGPVGFVSAIHRGATWFLSMLFVHPSAQGRGLGRALLEAVLPPPGSPLVRATCTDAAQPISNALYARHGIVPRAPVIELVGEPRWSALPRLPDGIRPIPFDVLAGPPDAPGPRRLADGLAALDRTVLGYAHPEDHAHLAAAGRVGYLYERGDGQIVAYAYGSPAGRLGPVAVADEALFPGVLGHLVRGIAPAGAVATWVPGAAGSAVTALLLAGLRIEDFPALLCWDRPFADLSRYVPISLAVL